MPESSNINALVPSLTVDDVVESLRFYTAVLGFAATERWEHEGQLRGASLEWGGASLMIGQDDWQKGRDRQKGQGLRLYVRVSGDIDALADGIRQRGGRLASEPADQPWGGRAFAIDDPSGYKLTFATWA